MPTDDERREVAWRLRELEKGVIGAFIPTRELAENILRAIDYGYSGAMTPYGRLADLVEPGEPEVRCVAEVNVDGERLEKLVHDAAVELTGIDRDALLEEAKELEKCARYFGLDFDEDEPLRDRLKEASEDFAGSADRIRKALGVES